MGLRAVSAAPALAANIDVGVSVITGGTTTRVLYDNAGVLGEAANLTIASSSSVLVTSSSFGLTGAISAPAWTTSGIRYANVASTLTDTTSSGTVATAYTNVFGANTIAASAVTTFTNYFNTYFVDPVQGGNVTLTSKWALGADSVKFGTSNQVTISTAGSLAMTGSIIGPSAITINAGGSYQFATRSRVTSNPDSTITFFDQNVVNSVTLSFPTATATPTLQLGSLDAAVAVAQTTRVQSVVAGTAAANGANWTLIGSLPTGTGTSGDIIFQTGVKTGSGTTQGTATTALTIKGETQTVTIASGKALQLGNAYVATPQVASGYIIIKDSNGTDYKVTVTA